MTTAVKDVRRRNGFKYLIETASQGFIMYSCFAYRGREKYNCFGFRKFRTSDLTQSKVSMGGSDLKGTIANTLCLAKGVASARLHLTTRTMYSSTQIKFERPNTELGRRNRSDIQFIRNTCVIIVLTRSDLRRDECKYHRVAITSIGLSKLDLASIPCK